MLRGDATRLPHLYASPLKMKPGFRFFILATLLALAGPALSQPSASMCHFLDSQEIDNFSLGKTKKQEEPGEVQQDLGFNDERLVRRCMFFDVDAEFPRALLELIPAKPEELGGLKTRLLQQWPATSDTKIIDDGSLCISNTAPLISSVMCIGSLRGEILLIALFQIIDAKKKNRPQDVGKIKAHFDRLIQRRMQHGG